MTLIRALRIVLPITFLRFECFVFSDYRYRKDEIFKRLKVTTFAQLVRVIVYFLVILRCPAIFGCHTQQKLQPRVISVSFNLEAMERMQ